MKTYKKVISGCLAVSMLLPLSGCGKSKKNFKMPNSEDFCSFLEKDMKAEKISGFNLPEGDWNKGFYYETVGFLVPGDIKYEGMNIKNLFRGIEPIKQLTNVAAGSELRNSADEMVSYFTNEVSTKDHGNKQFKRTGVTQKESEYEITYATLITFAEDSDALEFFENYMDINFEQDLDTYEEALNWYEENPDKLYMHQPRSLVKEKAEIQPREVYSLKALPKDVYDLDKKAGKGHFTYHIEDRWASVSDIFRADDKPEWITFLHVANDLSLQLDGNQVLLLFNCRYYEYIGCEEFYRDRWPTHEFEKSTVMEKFYKEFGVTDPEKIEISDDLNLELVSISGFDREYALHLPEIYRTSDEIPER